MVTRADLPTRRKAVAVTETADELVLQGHLSDEGSSPWTIRPVVDGLDLAEWVKPHADRLNLLLEQQRAVLFRGFGIKAVGPFQQVALNTSRSALLEYKDRSTPRPEVEKHVYVSTVYPSEKTIRLHNEGTYWRAWARKIYFGCLTAPSRGGQTPIADVRNVYRRIDPAIREEFAARQVMYVRNYNDGFGLPWQEVYQTTNPADVEAYCRENGIEWEWKSDGRLRTRQVRPAVRRHPATGEPLWFNHAAFFHISSQEPEVRRALEDGFGESELPFNTYFGDERPIPEDFVRDILAAYDAEKVLFDWQAGDVLWLDNMTFAHGREPYEGPRQIVVAMTEPYSDE